jgi:orotidine-5'-phosphate decarboxylase
MLTHRERIIVALDVETRKQALGLVEQLAGRAGLFKIGSQLFTAEGPQLVKDIIGRGEHVFLDLKFHDIPNTVANSVLVAADLGVSMLTLHASGGRKMMVSAVDALGSQRRGSSPLLLGVTVLTSIVQENLAEIGISGPVDTRVSCLAKLAEEAGLDGVVASPAEVVRLRAELTQPMKIVTPGIRPTGSNTNDQGRAATPVAALQAGADYLVIGRPITAEPDPARMLERILAEISEAFLSHKP